MRISLPHARLPYLNLRRVLIRAGQLRRSRSALAQLDAHALRDIGLSGQDAQNEARRPVWDAPEFWKQ